jgi:hypothetical protein
MTEQHFQLTMLTNDEVKFLNMMQETLLSSDTSFTVRAVIQLFINVFLRYNYKKTICHYKITFLK